MQLYRAGTLALPPVEVMPLEAAAAAHRKSESRTTHGKVVLHVQQLEA
jgi:NADPH:quinone reductase-like Zn-dependent oxidoreductase